MHERLSVYQAAKRLGISESAVRQRVHRGTLESSKDENGRLVVHVTAADMQSNGSTSSVISDDSTTLTSDYINTLKSQIESLEADKESLERDKEHLREESVRKDHIIMSLTQRIPAIEPPQADTEDMTEARDYVVSDSDDAGNGAVPQDAAEAKIKQPWWQRLFGG